MMEDDGDDIVPISPQERTKQQRNKHSQSTVDSYFGKQYAFLLQLAKTEPEALKEGVMPAGWEAMKEKDLRAALAERLSPAKFTKEDPSTYVLNFEHITVDVLEAWVGTFKGKKGQLPFLERHCLPSFRCGSDKSNRSAMNSVNPWAMQRKEQYERVQN